uniref:Uncharacterized protein n=1 Tax=Clastoptera arizonana TaxID=38151 RepID=A0A1B6CS84_9HEMI
MAYFKSEMKKNNVLINSVYSWFRPTRGLAEKSLSEKIPETNRQDLIKNLVPTSKFNKILLVMSGRYKKMSEVPESVSFESMHKARNKVRIRVANYFMGAIVIGCVWMVISGKKAAESGESVEKMNLDWHKEYNEQAKAEIAKTKH